MAPFQLNAQTHNWTNWPIADDWEKLAKLLADREGVSHTGLYSSATHKEIVQTNVCGTYTDIWTNFLNEVKSAVYTNYCVVYTNVVVSNFLYHVTVPELLDDRMANVATHYLDLSKVSHPSNYAEYINLNATNYPTSNGVPIDCDQTITPVHTNYPYYPYGPPVFTPCSLVEYADAGAFVYSTNESTGEIECEYAAITVSSASNAAPRELYRSARYQTWDGTNILATWVHESQSTLWWGRDLPPSEEYWPTNSYLVSTWRDPTGTNTPPASIEVTIKGVHPTNQLLTEVVNVNFQNGSVTTQLSQVYRAAWPHEIADATNIRMVDDVELRIFYGHEPLGQFVFFGSGKGSANIKGAWKNTMLTKEGAEARIRMLESMKYRVVDSFYNANGFNAGATRYEATVESEDGETRIEAINNVLAGLTYDSVPSGGWPSLTVTIGCVQGLGDNYATRITGVPYFRWLLEKEFNGTAYFFSYKTYDGALGEVLLTQTKSYSFPLPIYNGNPIVRGDSVDGMTTPPASYISNYGALYVQSMLSLNAVVELDFPEY